MADTGPARQRLYARLAEVLGEEHAVTMFRYLPPTEATELATRADLQALGDRLEQRMGTLEQRFDGLVVEFARSRDSLSNHFDQRFDALQRTLILGIPTTFLAVATLAFGAARLM